MPFYFILLIYFIMFCKLLLVNSHYLPFLNKSVNSCHIFFSSTFSSSTFSSSFTFIASVLIANCTDSTLVISSLAKDTD